LVVAALVPGLLMTELLCGGTLRAFPREQLFWGTDSLWQLFGQLFESSLARLNPQIVSPALFELLGVFRQYFGVLLLGALLFAMVRAKGELADARLRAGLLFAGLLGATVLAHWLVFVMFRVPLPYERTSIWLVPTISIACGALFAGLPRNFVGMGLLLLTSVYFVGCLRDDYFNEWTHNADMEGVYEAVLEQGKRLGTRDVMSFADYSPSLNYYRIYRGSKELNEIESAVELQPGHKIYVFSFERFAVFAKENRLREVFRGKVADVVVMVPMEGKSTQQTEGMEELR
jgi:hypothetical protein